MITFKEYLRSVYSGYADTEYLNNPDNFIIWDILNDDEYPDFLSDGLEAKQYILNNPLYYHIDKTEKVIEAFEKYWIKYKRFLCKYQHEEYLDTFIV